MAHPSLKRKASEEAAEQVAREFLEPFRDIAESRRKLVETEQELRGLMAQLTQKIDAFATLKKENLELERSVLLKIEAELNR